MNGETLKKELTDVFFTLDRVEFREFHEKTFADEETAKNFLINHLVAECNFGVIHTPEELLESHSKVETLLRQGNGRVFSKDLPMHPGKTLTDNFCYVLMGNTCIIQDAKNPQK